MCILIAQWLSQLYYMSQTACSFFSLMYSALCSTVLRSRILEEFQMVDALERYANIQWKDTKWAFVTGDAWKTCGWVSVQQVQCCTITNLHYILPLVRRHKHIKWQLLSFAGWNITFRLLPGFPGEIQHNTTCYQAGHLLLCSSHFPSP